MPKEYALRCQSCDKEFVDDGFQLECDIEHEPALLTINYISQRFEIDKSMQNIYRYQKWLPISHRLPANGRTITYQSKRLQHITGLAHLWIAFNGYWPEKGAFLNTTTFKELEAYAVLSRIPQEHHNVLVVASAGNTAAAFAQVCSQNNVPCLIIIPANGLPRLQFTEPLTPCVKIVTLTGLADYHDAIVLANSVSQYPGFISEGGVKNAARRAGLGTALLSAVEAIGSLPDYYFQAVGSGAGAIAVHEVAKKLVRDGRFGRQLPRLILCQNIPFAPMYHAWKQGSARLIERDENENKKEISQIIANVLSNQRPPYALRGGVLDALKESQGDMLIANNQEVLAAMTLFREAEDIDIDPAAGVALAALLKQARILPKDALILLNITGGGWERKRADYTLTPAQPSLQINIQEQEQKESVKKIIGLFD